MTHSFVVGVGLVWSLAPSVVVVVGAVALFHGVGRVDFVVVVVAVGFVVQRAMAVLVVVGAVLRT